jgi:LysM repeat protein
VAGAPCYCSGHHPVPVPYDPSYTTYTVQHGDTLYSIAHRYGTTVSAIMAANGLTNPDHIYAGPTLRIPTSG